MTTYLEDIIEERERTYLKPTLSDTFEVFSDSLDEIKENLAANMLDEINALEPIPAKEGIELELWQEVRRLEIAQITCDRSKIIKRINSRMEPPRAGRITAEDIERAKEVPIEELINTRVFGHDGGRKFTHCPFHQERSASFCIHKENRWSCFGACNEHGDVIDFVMKQEGVDFISAVKALINR